MNKENVSKAFGEFVAVGLGLLIGTLLFTFMSWVVCSIFSIAYSLPVALVTAMCAAFCLIWLSLLSVSQTQEKITKDTADLPPDDEPPSDDL